MGHREQLLIAARELLEDKGYAHITARDLVAASGTNLASIGYHFGSKAGLLNTALGEIFEQWAAQLAEAALEGPATGLIPRMHTAWAAVLDSLTAKRSLLSSFTEAMAQAERDPQLRAQLAATYHSVRARVSVLVAESLDEDVSAEDPQCVAIASFIIAVCDGLSLQWLLDPEHSPTADQLLGGFAKFWHG